MIIKNKNFIWLLITRRYKECSRNVLSDLNNSPPPIFCLKRLSSLLRRLIWAMLSANHIIGFSRTQTWRNTEYYNEINNHLRNKYISFYTNSLYKTVTNCESFSCRSQNKAVKLLQTTKNLARLSNTAIHCGLIRLSCICTRNLFVAQNLPHDVLLAGPTMGTLSTFFLKTQRLQ